MIIIGLTGSIASGKSTVASWIVERHIAVHDADAVAHKLLNAKGKAVSEIVAKFGQFMQAKDGGIDRKKLGDHVFNHPHERKILESILHPKIKSHREQFLNAHRQGGSKLVVLDVPLLFETGGDVLCDFVVVVYAKEVTMRKRAFLRDGMTEEKFSGILETQIPAAQKCQHADLILDTDLAPEITRQYLYDWLDNLMLTSETYESDNNA